MAQTVPSRYASLARLKQARKQGHGEITKQLRSERKLRSDEVSDLRDETQSQLLASGKSRRAAAVSGRTERLKKLKDLAAARSAAFELPEDMVDGPKPAPAGGAVEDPTDKDNPN